MGSSPPAAISRAPCWLTGIGRRRQDAGAAPIRTSCRHARRAQGDQETARPMWTKPTIMGPSDHAGADGHPGSLAHRDDAGPAIAAAAASTWSSSGGLRAHPALAQPLEVAVCGGGGASARPAPERSEVRHAGTLSRPGCCQSKPAAREDLISLGLGLGPSTSPEPGTTMARTWGATAPSRRDRLGEAIAAAAAQILDAAAVGAGADEHAVDPPRQSAGRAPRPWP